ncbi:hypothetical protein D3C84_1285690 [compost metagenome]
MVYLPLAKTQDDREVGTDSLTYALYNLRGKTGAFLERCTAVVIFAQIGASPEKLVDQIAVCAMNFNGVKT